MNYLVMLGSDMFYGTSGVLTVQTGEKFLEFFKIREIYKVRSEGSYLSIDCDIKDNDNIREVKLFKSKPVVINEKVEASYDLKKTIVKRKDDSIIIKIEQLDLKNESLSEFGPVKKTLSGYPSQMKNIILEQLASIYIDAVIKITGDFYAGQHHLIIKDDCTMIDNNKLSGNLSIGTGGLRLTNNGFGF